MFDRKLFYTVVSICVVAVIAVTISTLPEKAPEPVPGEEVLRTESDVQISKQANEKSSSASQDKIYIVREYDGHIAVFVEGAEEPQMVLDMQVKFLPDYDRILLKEGIRVESYEELSSLIEDYIS